MRTSYVPMRGAQVICPLCGSWMRQEEALMLLLHSSHNSVDACPAAAVAHHLSASTLGAYAAAAAHVVDRLVSMHSRSRCS